MTSGRSRRRLLVTSLIVFILFLCLPYVILPHINAYWVRWWWNYGASFHPSLAHVLPHGQWKPVDHPPRFVEEIFHAPWMGEWEIPRLSTPTFNPWDDAHSPFPPHPMASSASRGLLSPVLVKIHIFSTPTLSAQAKRNLIRSTSPLLNIPPPYRHLVEVKFIIGSALDSEGEIDREAEKSTDVEEAEHGDLVRLKLKNGDNLREGKILDWIRAVGTGADGGREAWFVFKVDDDVSSARGERSNARGTHVSDSYHRSFSICPTCSIPSSCSIPVDLTISEPRSIAGRDITFTLRGWSLVSVGVSYVECLTVVIGIIRLTVTFEMTVGADATPL